VPSFVFHLLDHVGQVEGSSSWGRLDNARIACSSKEFIVSHAGKWIGYWRWIWGVYTSWSTIQQNRRTRRAERHHRRTIERFLLDPRPSGKLGKARLGRLRDARLAGLVTGGKGILIGALKGAMLFYIGPSHLIAYAKNRGGKGIFLVLVALAHLKDRSIVVLCVKNGETTYATIEHRARFSNIVCLNPTGVLGLPNTRLNPLDSIVIAVREERARLDGKATPARRKPSPIEVAIGCMTMVIAISAEAREPWPKEEAQRFLAVVAVALAHTTPARCTLAGLQAFVARADADIIAELNKLAGKDIPAGVTGLLQAQAAMIADGKTQWAATRGEMLSALLPFAPGTPFAEATAATDFDFSSIKRDRTTVYVMASGTEMDGASRWLALVNWYLFRAVAASPDTGRVLFLLDEFLAMPRIANLERTVNLLPGLGVQLYFFVQSRDGLAHKYGRDLAENIESACDVMQTWSVSEEALLKRIEYSAGRTSVVTRGVNAAGGAVPSASFGLHESSRPLLQPEDITALGPRQQLLRVTGAPWFIADLVPYFEIKEYRDVIRDAREVTPSTVIDFPPRNSSDPT